MRRTLPALWFADVPGYSALDLREIGTLFGLRQIDDDLFRELRGPLESFIVDLIASLGEL